MNFFFLSTQKELYIEKIRGNLVDFNPKIGVSSHLWA